MNPVPAPANTQDDLPTGTSLLVLPTGEVMFVDGGIAVQFYTAAASPAYDPSWAPAISSAPSTISPGATYEIAGMQFNGLDQGSAFGDENQNSTNYPLVRIANNATGHVFYARTHDHSSMGVATGAAPDYTYFDVPNGIEAGVAAIQVVANGIPSTPVPVTIAVPAAGQAPAVTTGASSISSSQVTLNGSVNPGGAATQVWFEYGSDPAKGLRRPGTDFFTDPDARGSVPVVKSVTID